MVYVLLIISKGLKILSYGLSKKDIKYAFKKIEKRKRYIEREGFAPFTKNAWYNADKYIAELQNRASSLVAYASMQNLVSLFITLTLPSEYHPIKTLKNGKVIKNPKFIDDLAHTPKAGSKVLSRMWKRILDLRPVKDLRKEQKCYFRIIEPHKSGVPHLHVALYVPANSIEKILNSIFAIYTFPQIEISSQYIPSSYKKYYDKTVKRSVYKKNPKDKFGVTTLIKNPLKYMMKYILKTLDDLRKNKNKYTPLTLWYIIHGIGRFYTSRTLIPLWIYRKIHYLPRFQNMLNATKEYINGRIRVSAKKRIIEYLSLDENGNITEETIWQKRIEQSDLNPIQRIRYIKSFWKKAKVDFLNAYARKHPKIIPLEINGKRLKFNLTENRIISKGSIITPAYMKDHTLYAYYHSLDPEDEKISLFHYGVTQNEMIRRGLLSNIPIHRLDDFNNEFKLPMEETL